MNRTSAILLRALLLTIPVGAVVVAVAPGQAAAQDIAPPPPPDAYIATVQPEYYNGRPAYLYNGNWYFRDAHGWNYFHTEPAYLRDRRSHQNEHARYHYHR
jgi:hypothetical protein